MIEQDPATPEGGAKFGAFTDSGLDGDSLFRSAEAGASSATETDADPQTKKKKTRRRGGRRKKASRSGEESSGADRPRDADESGDEGSDKPARKKRSRRRSSSDDDAPAKPKRSRSKSSDTSDEDSGEDRPAAKKRRRSRRRKTSAGTDAHDDEDGLAQKDLPRISRADLDDVAGEDQPKKRSSKSRRTKASEQDSDEDADGDEKPKRRRRGTRGGRKRKKKTTQDAAEVADGPAVIEAIPGEEDDLPELPELPEETELLEKGGRTKGGRKKRERKKTRESGRGRSKAKDDDDDDAPPQKSSVKRSQQILVNSKDREEARVAVIEGGKLIDLQINAATDQNLVSDVYRGRVVNIEASIGAAFIDFGRGRNGFLHTSDVLPDYGEKDWKLEKLLSTHVDPSEWDELSSQPHIAAEVLAEDEDDDHESQDEDSDDVRGKGSSKRGKKGKKKASRQRRRPRTPITDLLKVGQRVVVQVTKDAIGDKGPTLTTYLSIPGRYLVLMPSMQHTGVSRKIEDPKERKRLKRVLDSFAPKGMGVIARTAASGRTKTELKRDLEYLLGAWERFSEKLSVGHGPTALYQESDVAIKTVRDLFGPATDSVIVDDDDAYESIREFAERLMPDQVDRIKLHDGNRPIFHTHGVEQDYEKVFSRRLELPSGGSIVIDQAEALVAIDVNSGKTRTDSFDFEEIALKTNLEAVPEIARQIRLRDLGGILVIDFIDMMRRTNMRLVEKAFREAFSGDRARSKLGRISQFGLLEMTRQRLGPGIGKRLYVSCQHCRGLGKIRTVQSRAAALLRRLGSSLTLKGFSQVEVRAQPDLVLYLKENHREELEVLEALHNRKLKLTEVPDQLEDSVLRYLRADGREVRPGGRRKR